MITKEQILTLSKHFDIDQFTILREYIQIIFLSNLYGLGEGDNIYFKGGSALKLMFNSFRFSEDLDFTSLLNEKELKALLEKTIKRVNLEAPGVKVNSLKVKRISLAARLNYSKSSLKFPLTVHLKFSLREKPKTRKISPLTTLYPISPYPMVVHLSLSEILAEKVRALMIRGKGRDIFDIWYILTKDMKFNWELINQKMKYYKMEIKKEDVVKKIEEINSKEIKNDLMKFLPKRQRTLIGNLKELTIKKMQEN